MDAGREKREKKGTRRPNFSRPKTEKGGKGPPISGGGGEGSQQFINPIFASKTAARKKKMEGAVGLRKKGEHGDDSLARGEKGQHPLEREHRRSTFLLQQGKRRGVGMARCKAEKNASGFILTCCSRRRERGKGMLGDREKRKGERGGAFYISFFYRRGPGEGREGKNCLGI